MRTALYIRYSSEKQKQGSSLRDQLQRLQMDALQAGEEVVETFIDQAVSGTSVKHRKEYQRLMAFVQAGRCDIVRLESVDRGHRNDGERREFEAALKAAKVEIVYSGETRGQAPEQRTFNRSIKGIVAELESGQISQRTYDRQLYRAKQGRRRGGSAPYGTLIDGQWYRPDPETYPTLIWILEQRGLGHGYQKITNILNHGISLNGGWLAVPVPPGYLAWLRNPWIERQDPLTGDIVQTPRPCPRANWNTSTVRNLCRDAISGVLAGIVHWGREKRKFTEDRYGQPKQEVIVDTGKALIPPDLIARVRATEQAHEHFIDRTLRPRSTFLLRLRCGLCGGTVYGATSSNHRKSEVYHYRTYTCIGRRLNAGSCTLPALRSYKIDRVIVKALLDYTASNAYREMQTSLNQSIGRYRDELTATIATLTKTITDLEADQARSLDILLRTDLTSTVLEALNHRLSGIAGRIADTRQQRDTVQAGIAALDQRARTIRELLSDSAIQADALDRIEEVAVIKALQPAVAALVAEATLHHTGKRTMQVALKLRTLDGIIRGFGSDTGLYELQLTDFIPIEHVRRKKYKPRVKVTV